MRKVSFSAKEREDPGVRTAPYKAALIRAPFMPLLHVEEGPHILFQPFKSPLLGHTAGVSDASLIKTLGCRLRKASRASFANGNFKVAANANRVEEEEQLPPPNPLILYSPNEEHPDHSTIEVTPVLTRWLRQHQRQGVQFVFDCLMGRRGFNGEGCILADDMGLGKTLQSIAVMWTLLEQGYNGKPTVQKAVIICPASLVDNWSSEIEKWLKGRCACTAVADSSRDKVVSKFEGFQYDRTSRVLISSYETFRMHSDKLAKASVGLIICDEAHRLKNDRTKTAVAIASMAAQKRLLLSGTPIQNDLDEFYSLVSLCNPNILGEPNHFRKIYANPILVGREPDATENQQQIAAERLIELSNTTNLFILRRTNSLLAKVLPPKVVMNVFCRLTPIQKAIYQNFLDSNSCRKLLLTEAKNGLTGRVLSSIQGLLKLCNHPSLLRVQSQTIQGFDSCNRYLDEIEEFSKTSRVRTSRPDLSGKLLLLSRLLRYIRKTTSDRVVLISNYTQTLDLVDRLCKENNYPSVRLDGGTAAKKRHAMVTSFNDLSTNNFVFLLSSKAGGCGINLIGANRLVMYDPDWNPANDKQALARIWRDGQKKQCYIYRLFSTGTIEEKIFQRQICKDGLSTMIVSEGQNQMKDSLASELVKDLFTLRENCKSDTHDMLQCDRCNSGNIENEGDASNTLPSVAQSEVFNEDDLITWAHHYDCSSLPDIALQSVTDGSDGSTVGWKWGAEESAEGLLGDEFQPVSFVMSCRVDFQESQTVDATTEAIEKKLRVTPAEQPLNLALQKKIKKGCKSNSSSESSDEEQLCSEDTEIEIDEDLNGSSSCSENG